MSCLRFGVVVVALLVGTMSLSPASLAQDSDSPEFDGLNFAFAAVTGSGAYSVNGRTALIVRAPISIPLWTTEDKPWGLRIIAPITFGFFDLEPEDIFVGVIPERLGTISPVVGAEGSRELTGNWTFFPFAFGGPAYELETGEAAWLVAGGARSRAVFFWGERPMVLWNRLVYARNFQNELVADDDFMQFETDFELRFPVTDKTAVGLIVANELYFNVVVIDRPGESFEIIRRWEVAVSYGPTWGDVKLWKFKLPRISLGYRFGQGTTGYKLGFRYKF